MLVSEEIIGKLVTVRIPYRDFKGKLVPNKYESMKGVCTFYGETVLGIMSITIDRTPVYPITERDIIKIE
jgi:hypothetical protein